MLGTGLEVATATATATAQTTLTITRQVTAADDPAAVVVMTADGTTVRTDQTAVVAANTALHALSSGQTAKEGPVQAARVPVRHPPDAGSRTARSTSSARSAARTYRSRNIVAKSRRMLTVVHPRARAASRARASE